MESVITIETDARLSQIAVNRIIAQAKEAAKDSSLNIWRDVYEPAKWAIAEFGPSADEYQHAIRRLAEALNI